VIRKRFIQITSTQRSDGSPALFALDEVGSVWQLSPDERSWLRVTQEREEDNAPALAAASEPTPRQGTGPRLSR
jgi:hypothetical protein